VLHARARTQIEICRGCGDAGECSCGPALEAWSTPAPRKISERRSAIDRILLSL
jgi:hypothetical protein